MSLPPQTFYSVLGVSEEADLATIRNAYMSLALEFHPDKCDDQSKSEVFPLIQRAWEILKDTESRYMYDRDLKESRLRESIADNLTHVAEEVHIDDMDECEEGYTYRCRCGESYCLFEESLVARVSIVDCSGCSLRIKVMYD